MARRISSLFGYIPLTRPDPPSDARRRAYKRSSPLPGPALDPIGWQSMRRVDISGSFFRLRESSVTYSVSLFALLLVPRNAHDILYRPQLAFATPVKFI